MKYFKRTCCNIKCHTNKKIQFIYAINIKKNIK